MTKAVHKSPFEGALFYRPPYDSPLEDLFAYNYEKYASPEIKLETQVEVTTCCGRFRLDFLMTAQDGRSVAIECDGEDFHDASRDEWRDAMILGASEIRAIYRLPGSAAFHHTNDCLYLLSIWEKWMFTERGLLNLRRLASDEAIALTDALRETGIHIAYKLDDNPGRAVSCELARHSLQDRFLRTALAFGLRAGCSDLDEVRARYLGSQAEPSAPANAG